ncbi:MAG: sulfotransferase [Gammaproteobacteria bacterium]|nr:sulfotransferase [Gammaproteobacteria bacterium]
MNNLAFLRELYAQQQYLPLKKACLAEKKDQYAVQILLILASINLNQLDGMEALFNQLLEHEDQLDHDALCDLAAVFILHSQAEQATQRLARLVKEDPQHSLALARLGLCHLMTQRLSEAADCFAHSATLDPSRIAVWSNLADVHCQLTQYDHAQNALDQGRTALEQQQDELSEFFNQQHRQRLRILQLQLWIETDQHAEAEHWFELVDAQDDEDQSVLWRGNYANMLAERDHHEEAAEVLREGLKPYPHNSILLMQLSELAQLQGRSNMAIKTLERVIKQDKENPLPWIKLSAACLHQQTKRARTTAEKAVKLAATLKINTEYNQKKIAALRLQAQHALAQVESQEQNFDLAEQLFRKILELDPKFTPALQSLGQQQMQRGNIDDAISLFEKLKSLDPVKGHSALISARHFPDDETTLEQLNQAAHTPSMEGSARTSLLFQLASAWEKRQQYDKAFAFAQEANDLSQRFITYDAKEHRNRCARIRHAFSKSLYDVRRDCGVDSSVPVYVLGMPRSGTTLVEQILAGHSEIAGAGELGLIPAVVQGLNRWERHVGSGRSFPDCVDDLNPYISSGIADNVLKELQEYDPKAKHVIDKLPHNFENIGLIKFLFPKAKIISVRRDPRDIAISNFFTDYQAKHGGMGFAYDLTHIGEQLADHNLLMQHWHQLFPGEILEINYEDVVNDTEGSARKMLDYIGVDWQPQVVAFNELDRPVKTASVWQVRQPIYKTSTAKWKRYQENLSALTAGTNARIEFDPISDMLSLPEPAFLQDGFALYKKQDLDGAEYLFKKMLHHNPNHAACNYMVGEIYLRKNNLDDGVKLIEKALKHAPWKREWSTNLLKAYNMSKQHEKAAALTKRYRLDKKQPKNNNDETHHWQEMQIEPISAVNQP